MSMNRYAMLARRVDLFRSLEPDDVAKIFARGLTMEVDKGKTIFLQGTTGNTLYIVLGGTVALYDGKKHLADLKTGDMFGEMALVSHEPRSATAVAAETCSLFSLDETTFQKLLTKRIAVTLLLNIIAVLGKRLRASNQKLLRLQENLSE